MFKKPVLMIDTREQNPLNFKKWVDKFEHIISATLTEGDYTVYVPGDNRKIAFERKSLQDLVGTVARGKDRFRKELERLKQYEYRAIIIESTYSKVSSPYTFSQFNPKSVIGSLQAFQLQYGVDVIFSGDRQNSAEIIIKRIENFYGN